MESIKISMEQYSSQVDFISFTEIFSDNDRKKLFVCDTNTAFLVPEPLSDETIIIKAGEQYKQWKSIDKILELALRLNLGRDDYIVGIGGGVITDMAAFASSLYMRGCKLILAPTTVLSMVDAAIGGKTGVDYQKYKNMIGSFYPAEQIVIDPKVTESLKESEYRSGLAEVIKSALLSGGKFFEFITNNRAGLLERDEQILNEAIYNSVMLKASIVEKDLREQNIRGYLNLGHTFGHALETACDFKGVSHGEAVAWGIAKAMDAGVMIGKTPDHYANTVKQLLIDYGFEIRNQNIKTEKVLEAMTRDKKKRQGKVRFILQKSAGNTFYEILENDVILDVIS